MLILEGPPQPFDKDVVQSPAATIHTHPHSGSLDPVGEGVGRELDALVSVENLRLALSQGLLQGNQAEVTIQSVGQLPGQDITTIPIDDRGQVHKTALHRNVGDVAAPDLQRPVDEPVAQQVGINPVGLTGVFRMGLGINRLQAHQLHQPLHPLMVDGVPLPLQVSRHSGPAIERGAGVLFINQSH